MYQLKNKNWNNYFSYCYHLFLISIYPILFLYSCNIEEITDSSMLLRAGILSLIVAVTILLIFYLFNKNIIKASILAFTTHFGLFHFARVYDWIDGYAINGFVLGRLRYLIPLFFMFIFFLYRFISRSRESYMDIAKLLNLVAIILLAAPLFTIFKHSFVTNFQNQSKSSLLNYPDIYYIVADSYMREDVLRNLYNYDNSKFTTALKQMGFFVAPRSTSNYFVTGLSVPSSLNMNFHPHKKFSVHNSFVQQYLQNKGYTFVAFNTGYAATTVADADVFFKNFWDINEFEYFVLRSSIFGVIHDLGNYIYRLRENYIYDRLKAIPEIVKGPKFVFAHLRACHWPFVFKADGSSRRFTNINKHKPSEVREVYVDQLKYTNSMLLKIVEAILSKSEKQPVIIIQGDHGSFVEILNRDQNDMAGKYLNPSRQFLRERLSILNCILADEKCTNEFYPDITPVNTFRLIFNHLFKENLPLLQDKQFWVSDRKGTLLQIKKHLLEPAESNVPDADVKKPLSVEEWAEK